MSVKSPSLSVSRRTFVRYLGIGATSSALSLSAGPLIRSALAQSQEESGFITLDGIFITYFSAPLGPRESRSWSILKKYSTTFSLKSVQNPEIVFKASVAPGRESFGFWQSSQMNSSVIDSAISLLLGTRGHLTTTASDALFYVVTNPRLFLRGTPNKLRFRFDDLSSQDILYASDPHFNNFVTADTAASMMTLYVTDPAMLVAPRFTLQGLTEPASQTFSLPGNVAADPILTATATAKIMGSQGFASDALKQALSVGSDLEITYYSVQEVAAPQILTMQTEFDSASPVFNNIYVDHLFKTFMVA